MRLFLTDNERLFKNSYVTTKPCRTIEATLLRRWRNGKYKLRDDSFRELVEHINFDSPWPKTTQHPSPLSTPQPIHYTPPEWISQYLSPPATSHSSVRAPQTAHNILPAGHMRQHPLQSATTPSSHYIPSYTKPPVRPARPYHHPPGQWSNPYDPYVRRERTPLLHPSHIYEPPSTSDDDGSTYGDFARVVVVIAAMVGAAWYFKMF